jgi:hypothetical protein
LLAGWDRRGRGNEWQPKVRPRRYRRCQSAERRSTQAPDSERRHWWPNRRCGAAKRLPRRTPSGSCLNGGANVLADTRRGRRVRAVV